MRSYVMAFSIASASLFSACAVLPEFEEDAVETAEIIKNIKCEFREAAWLRKDPHGWLEDWNGAFVLTLAVNHKGTATADANLVHPLNIGGNLNAPLIIGGFGEGTRTEKITFKERISVLRDAPKIKCDGDQSDGHQRRMLGGRIGIADLLDRAREAKHSANINPSNLDYTLNFRVQKNASLGPKFSLIPVGINTLTAGVKLEGSRERTHTLNITLQPNPPDCLFKDLKDRTGVCPDFVVSIPLDPPKNLKLRDKDGKPFANVPENDRQKTIPFETIVPRTQRPPISRSADDALDRALTRSILQDTLDEIRRRGINPQ